MKVRTSASHPLQIAEVRAGPGRGSIGVTFCPGKVQSSALTGSWERDLGTDLAAIAQWGAAAVVSLVETHELQLLRVDGLGDEVRRRHMRWHHLPIRDVAVPSADFEESWLTAGDELRAIVRDGFNVLVHCKGGLGRAGLVAARLLIELGMRAEDAIAAVRAVRPGAIETAGQLNYVKDMALEQEPVPDASVDAARDRAIGSVIGLAIGDALGTTLEFAARDSRPPVTDLIGGGPFKLQAGQWTDDTAMALALMDSLLSQSSLDEADLMRRFVRWHEEGAYSCTGRCFDIGITTRQALMRWKTTGCPLAGSTDPWSAGNGSLMRLAPVVVSQWTNRKAMRDIAARQSRTTHAAPEAVDACVAYAEIVADAVAGKPRSEVMSPRRETYTGVISSIIAGSWRGKHRDAVKSSGYVAHSLEAALWCVGRTGNFRDAVLLAANLGDDADTTAAITGQLAGALYGLQGIPPQWIERLAWAEQIAGKASDLFNAGLAKSTAESPM